MPGDIVGLFDPGIFSIGDTIFTGKKPVQFAGIPTFAPERAFARVTQVDTLKRKQFVKGMEQLAQEGAIQMFRELGAGMESVIVGVVGTLQFEVLEQRLKSEYHVEVRRQPLPYTALRWIANKPDHRHSRALAYARGTLLCGEHAWRQTAAVHERVEHRLGDRAQPGSQAVRVRQRGVLGKTGCRGRSAARRFLAMGTLRATWLYYEVGIGHGCKYRRQHVRHAERLSPDEGAESDHGAPLARARVRQLRRASRSGVRGPCSPR